MLHVLDREMRQEGFDSRIHGARCFGTSEEKRKPATGHTSVGASAPARRPGRSSRRAGLVPFAKWRPSIF